MSKDEKREIAASRYGQVTLTELLKKQDLRVKCPVDDEEDGNPVEPQDCDDDTPCMR